MRVDVCFTTDELVCVDLQNAHVIMVDVLRASTTMVAALSAGASGIWPVSTPGEARKLREERDVLIGGERHGLALEGFDLGNSPDEYTRQAVGDPWIALTTTNGTRALLTAAAAATLWVGCFNNLASIVEGIEYCSPDTLVISCAGTEGGTRVAAEDVLFAGMLLDHLDVDEARQTDGARLARDFSRMQQGSLSGTMQTFRSGAMLQEIGLGRDIERAGQLNCCSVIPHCQSTGLSWPLSTITLWER